jgi:hypothetical protein
VDDAHLLPGDRAADGSVTPTIRDLSSASPPVGVALLLRYGLMIANALLPLSGPITWMPD